MSTPAAPQRLDDAALRRWPLPSLDHDADKEARGRVLVIAGSRELPGAALLAATSALRTGAGKLVVATAASLAPPMGFALPEARVIPLPETEGGGLCADGLPRLEKTLAGCSAVLIGPGLMDRDATQELVRELLPRLDGTPVILDALAMDVMLTHRRFEEPVLLTPHAGEMAHLTGLAKEKVLEDPLAAAREAARRWNAVVALKGATTVIATEDGAAWVHEAGNCGLATSGSGDTLAGAIAGLAARGASLPQACAWGVVLHAQAGERLARRTAPVGFLARELPQEMTTALGELAR